jgi:hypothetical protein
MVAPITSPLSQSLDGLDGETEPFWISPYDDVLKAEIAMDPGSDNEFRLNIQTPAWTPVEGLWCDATFAGYLRKKLSVARVSGLGAKSQSAGKRTHVSSRTTSFH